VSGSVGRKKEPVLVLSASATEPRTKNQIKEEKEELEIAGQIDAAKDLHDLKTLLREGRMKEFYETANKYMRIKRSNPVVTKVKRNGSDGEVEIFEDRIHVEKAICDYFSDIYRRPEHMAPDAGNDMEDEEMINTSSLFTMDDVVAATKCSNFNKGLGPDCFDGNMLKSSAELNVKIMAEVTDALNTMRIPEYLRVGRLVTIQKTSTNGPVGLDEIRPIVVRSHVAKILEKAIMAKVAAAAPHLL
jgi:hypothetical protein